LVNDRELFQFGELLKSARDRKLDRYLEIHDGLEPRFQRQRIVVESSVQIARKTRKRRQMIAALAIMAEHYPTEPLYSLMLLDYYFPSRKYEEAFLALQLLSDRLDVEDAAMDARLSAAALVMENSQDATAYAEMALEREPGLELAWWSALNARAASSDFAGSVVALQQLEAEFGYKLGPDALQKNPGFAPLIASDEFKGWLETRQ
jgi:tetratricopeptide (TPR) repeat protein